MVDRYRVQVVETRYELDSNEVPPGDDNAYDSVNPSEPTASTSKPPENPMSSVYAVVDKENRDGKTVCTRNSYVLKIFSLHL